MEKATKQTLIMALIGIVIGVIGILAYQKANWLFYICASLCWVQFLLSIVTNSLKETAFPFFTVCLIAGYFLTGTVLTGICYGSCLYYAIAFIYSIVLYVVPFQIIMIIVPVVSIIAYFCHAEHLFLLTSLYCTVNYLVALFKGRLPFSTMEIFLCCMSVGVILFTNRESVSLHSIQIIKGFLWGGAAYYVVVALYSFYRVFINKKL